MSTQTPNQPASAETFGSKVFRNAAKMTAPAQAERSIKVPLRNAVGAMLAAAVLLGSLTGLQGVIQDQMDPRTEAASGAAEFTPEERENVRSNTLMKHYECSASGLANDVVPAHALVRLAGAKAGRVSFVSFDEGWDVHMNSDSGKLVAVCAK